MSIATRTIGRLLRRSGWFDAPRDDGRSRRFPSWASQYAPARQQLLTRWRDSARSHHLISASPTARSITDQFVTNLNGDGPSVRAGHPVEPMREALEDAWNRWSENVDVTGQADLAGLLAAAVRSLVTTGEILIQHLTTARGEYRVKLLSPEQLEPAMTREVEDMQRIIAGVEYDWGGQIVAYWLWPRQADLLVATMQPAPIRVPAEDIAHVFEPLVPGQVRGTPWLTPVLTTILQIDQLQDALLARANTAALFGAFVTDPSGTSGFGGDGMRDPQELSLEPGVMRILPPDCTVTFPAVPDSAGTPELLRHMLRQVAAGVGIPYELLSQDLSNTNYSSAKLGLEAFKRRCKGIRETLLVARLLRPMWRRWVTLEVLSGRLQAPGFTRDPSDYFKANFLFPLWESLDPWKEAQADVALINAGVRSRQEVIAARGRDPADVDAEIAADTFVPKSPPVAGNQQSQLENLQNG